MKPKRSSKKGQFARLRKPARSPARSFNSPGGPVKSAADLHEQANSTIPVMVCPSIGEQIARLFAPQERLPIYDWLAKYWTLSPPITKTGPFDVSSSRHFIAIFDAWQDDRVREVNVLKPVRGGGSLIGDGICLYGIAADPGPYLEVFQTETEAKFYAEARTMMNFKNCPPVRELFPADRHKLRDNEIAFSHGHTWYNVGPAISNLQTKSIRHLRMEEVWMWPQGKMNEAMGRIGDYLKLQTSKVLTISQGGPADGFQDKLENSDWWIHYHRGQIHEWEVECPHCRKFFEPVFSATRLDGSFWGITWNKYQTPAGDWDVAKCLPTIRFECGHCGQPILDGPRTKQEWNRTGRYRAVGEANEKRKSFHWETVIDFPWIELVELWLEACNAEKRGNLRPKIQFYQKRRAMFKDEEALLRGGLNLQRSAYEITSDWKEERARFLTVDRQEEDLFWVTIRAWSTEKSRRLFFGKIYGFGAIERLREEWKVAPNRVLIDSRYQPKGDNGVYAACVRYGWVAVQGAKEYVFIHRLRNKRSVRRSYSEVTWCDPQSGTVAGGRRRCPMIRFSKGQMNAIVQQLIDSGAWEEPLTGDADLEKEYNAQMAARVKLTEFDRKTNEVRVYWKEGHNDHARDLANHQALAAILADLLPDPVAEQLSKSEKKEPTT